ncbi:hypothetical protein GBA52_021649 [Prunus armeniaca]|nr:hypothetical protein GBA52_021649 [Prunus armeniaca]
MEELKDRPGPSYKSKKVLYLCFGEYFPSTWVYYSIHAFNLEKNCHIIPLAESIEVAKTMRYVPVIMGSGVYGSMIVLAGGIRPGFDGLANFIPRPCSEVYAFDTAIMNSHLPVMIQRHASPELEDQIDHLSGDVGFELMEEPEEVFEELNTHQVQNML